ncbi:uncharacterized protein [Triticum aestivum]|uniref:uncharacterized protein n=1 Tax=Triticum aestivum TaxID=4565 RepID=UPI001D016C92|nr:uncharacterized protein LOC123153294 [Triticum aestivum]
MAQSPRCRRGGGAGAAVSGALSLLIDLAVTTSSLKPWGIAYEVSKRKERERPSRNCKCSILVKAWEYAQGKGICVIDQNYIHNNARTQYNWAFSRLAHGAAKGRRSYHGG